MKATSPVVRQIDYPESYCGYCCHYHDPGVECRYEYPPTSSLSGDPCGCDSTLEQRERILLED